MFVKQKKNRHMSSQPAIPPPSRLKRSFNSIDQWLNYYSTLTLTDLAGEINAFARENNITKYKAHEFYYRVLLANPDRFLSKETLREVEGRGADEHRAEGNHAAREQPRPQVNRAGVDDAVGLGPALQRV